jgi:hypothetical protein
VSKVRIADFPEAEALAGRYGVCLGDSVPSSSGVAPVIGQGFGGNAREDYALSVYFEETGEQEWFAPHLVERVED